MVEGKKMMHVVTRLGDEVQIGDLTVRPQSQALILRWPKGGFVWNRPLAVLVEQNGDTVRIPILDVTLVARAALFGLAAACSIGTLMLSARGRRE